MFAYQPWTRTVLRVLLIAVIFFNALTPTAAVAKSTGEIENSFQSSAFSPIELKIGERSSEQSPEKGDLHVRRSIAAETILPLIISGTHYVDSVRTTLTQSASSYTLYVADTTGFAAGDEVLVMSMQGAQAGQYETVYVDTVEIDRLNLPTSCQPPKFSINHK